MKSKIKTLILFNKSQFDILIKQLGLSNLKCQYCDKKLTKNTIGHIITKEISICQDHLCLSIAVITGLFHKGGKF